MMPNHRKSGGASGAFWHHRPMRRLRGTIAIFPGKNAIPTEHNEQLLTDCLTKTTVSPKNVVLKSANVAQVVLLLSIGINAV
jgi:hypothetical protein